MKWATIAILAGLFCLSSPKVQARSDNPFGFETNTHPLEYEYCKKEPSVDRGHGYKCSSAPRPHPDLEAYGLMFVEEVGLCYIGAVTKVERSLTRFAMFQTQIAKKYGPPTYVKKNGGKMRGKNVQEGLPTGESRWEPRAGFIGVGDIHAIRLVLDHKRILVSFWLVTFDKCEKAIDQKRAEAF